MASETLPLAERIEALLEHLDLERVHLVGCMSGDWGPLLPTHTQRICSLTVVAPHLNKGVPDHARSFPSPTLVIAGDQGTPAKRAQDLAGRFGQGQLIELPDYSSLAWADTVADWATEIVEALDDFFKRAESETDVPTAIGSSEEGEVAGISYRIEGNGPAVVFLPLSMAPSQWEPLVSQLSARYAVIRLGGPHLGVISLLEARAQSGYGDLVAQLLDQTNIGPNETALEVGCGSGALTRLLAKELNGNSSIVGTDINPYLLSEAQALAANDALSNALSFEEANAEALPYPDAHFDVSFCCTVLEEGDADRMLSELARVTRPGGRIAVLTRAVDVDWWVNLSLPPELKRKIESLGPSTGSGVGDQGCADASLYSRLMKVGLTPLLMGPQFALYRDDERLDDVLDRLIAQLSDNDAKACREAVRDAEDEGVLFVAG
jgi:SAM-dependent methyltransferase